MDTKAKKLSKKKTKTQPQIRLGKITLKDENKIYKLTTDSRVMKYIGNGKVWTKEKVSKFIKYNLNETKLSDQERENYYFKIARGSTFIGIISFHTFPYLEKYKDCFFLTIYLKYIYSRKGFGSKAIKLLLKKITKHKPSTKFLYSMVRVNNKPMNLFSKKKNFKLVDTINFGKNQFNIYQIPVA